MDDGLVMVGDRLLLHTHKKMNLGPYVGAEIGRLVHDVEGMIPFEHTVVEAEAQFGVEHMVAKLAQQVPVAVKVGRVLCCVLWGWEGAYKPRTHPLMIKNARAQPTLDG